MKKQDNIEFQKHVRQVLVDLGKETHYLLDKPVNKWDEYDEGNWKAIIKEYKSPLSRFEMQELTDEIRKRLDRSPGLARPLKELVEWYNQKMRNENE